MTVKRGVRLKTKLPPKFKIPTVLVLTILILMTLFQVSLAAPNAPMGASTLGDFVWEDLNADGVKDPGEPGINGVTVNLYQDGSNGNPMDGQIQPGELINTMVTGNDPTSPESTSNDGYYDFPVTAGPGFVYMVEIPDSNFDPGGPLENYIYTGNNAPNVYNGDEPRFIPLPGLQVDYDEADFGYVKQDPVSLGNLVWHDANNDGLVGADEDGIDGVVVELYRAGDDPAADMPVATDTTSGGGFYNFDDLIPGEYFVYIPNPPSDYPMSSTPTDGADNQEDNDDNGGQPDGFNTPVRSPDVMLSGGTEPTDDGDGSDGDLTIDFGFFSPVRVGDLVWDDANNNGLVDPGENGIPGATIQLFALGQDPKVDTPIQTDITDADGLYSFEDLEPGEYFVYMPTPPTGFPNSSDPTDVTANNGVDNNDNGIQAAGPGTEINSSVFELFSGMEPTDDGDGPNGDLTIDFGFYADNFVNLGDLVWFDANDNGMVDAGEDGVEGVEVQLFNAGDDPMSATPVMTDTTDADGLYNFDGLAEGTYFVYIPNPPAEAPTSSTPTDSADNGENDDDNGDQPGGTGTPIQSPDITLAAGQEPDTADDGDGMDGDLTVDFGLYAPLSIGNTVWEDANNNGIQDPGEAGIEGVEVQLFPAGADPTTDAPIASDTTDPDGLYEFEDLAPGDYFLYIPTPPADAPNSSDNTDMADNDEDGDDNGDQPGGSGAPVTSPVFNLTSGEEPTNDAGDDDDQLDDANSNQTMDFGFYPDPVVNLGNLVWLDKNDDGMVDTDETGIDGVVVELYDSTQTPGTDTPLATQTTSGGGFYNFLDLAPGDYVVHIPEPPTGYPTSSTPTDGADNQEDNDDNGDQPGGSGTAVTSPVITLEPDTEPTGDGDTVNGNMTDDDNGDLTVDFGFFAPLSLGDTVWNDVNNDGVLDPGEPGIEGVVVELYEADQTPGVDTPIATDTTDPDGLYSFDDLAPGDYILYIPTPPADTPNSSDNTDPNDNGEDNDDNGSQSAPGAPVESPVITLSSNEEPTDDGDDSNGDQTVDFGFYEPTGLSLGNQVWFDENNDGIKDPEEEGINGVVVELYEIGQAPGFDTPIATDTTDGDGFYGFNGLEEGTYVVYIPEPPADYPISSDNTDMADNQEDDDDNGDQPGGSGTPITSPEITLTTGEEPTDDGDDENGDQTVDFGLYAPPLSVGNQVWEDADNDGIKDPEEAGIEGVVVELYEEGADPEVDDPIATTKTDPDGNYMFEDLNPGDYFLYIPEPPADFPTSSDNTDMADNGEDDDDNGDQPDGSGTPVTSPVFNLSPGTEPADDGDPNSDETMDFGFYASSLVNLGDLVWFDKNDDGMVDPDESGIEGVDVQLFKAGDDPTTATPVATDTTDADGLYNFDGLDEGTYFVYIPNPPAMAPASSTPTDGDDNGENDDDNGDQPDGSGTPVRSPDVILVSGQEPVEAEDGDGTDGDLTVDFGFYTPVDLGDEVWHDADNDGIKDPEEDGIEGVLVELYPAGADPTVDAPIATDTTDPNGMYEFEDLAPGDYFLYIPTPPADFPNSSDLTDTADNGEDDDDNGIQDNPGDPVMSPVINLMSGEEPVDDGDDENGDQTVDFGFYQPVDLGNQVWHDANNDGIKDPEEAGIEGVVVELYEAGADPVADAPIATDTTDPDGIYNFEDLAPGDYIVYIPEPPADFPASSDNTDPNDNGEDNDDNGSQATPGSPVESPVINLMSGDEPTDDGDGANGDQTVDFGFYEPTGVRLGNQVWHDADNDGQLDPEEEGINGVVVELYEAGQTPGVDAPIATDTTDGDGFYNFNGLEDGTYIVYIPEPPADYPLSSDNTDMADNGEDNDDNGDQPGGAGTPIMSPEIALGAGQEPADDGDDENGDQTVDFGLYSPPLSVGNTVWHDADNDGVQDPEESGIADVVIELYEEGADPTVDDPIATVTTGPDGDYLFEDVPPGDYFLYIPEPPADYPTSSDVTDMADNGEDGDDNGDQPDGTGTPVMSPVFNLSPGTEPADDGDPNSDETMDFGFYAEEVVNLGNLVWFDANDDGMVDGDEQGIAGVDVELYDADQTPGTDTPLMTTTTDADGHYYFDELVPGDYIVYIPNPPAEAPTSSTPTDMADNQEDSDDNGDQPAGSGTPVMSPVISLAPDQEPTGDGDVERGNDDDDNGDLTVDFGFFMPVSVGNSIWNDANNDGIQDPEEPGIEGVIVELYEAGADPATDDPVATVTTDPDGNYMFDDIAPGDYFLYIPEPPADYPTSSDNTDMNDNGEDGDDNGDQPEGTGTPVMSPVFNLTPGQEPGDDGDPNSDETMDFGFYAEEVVNLGNLVWFDANDDGMVDGDEQGIEGVDVELYEASQTPGTDTPQATTTTDADGHYYFDDLAPGDYIVYIPNPPADAPTSSTPTDGADNGEDGDDNGDQPDGSGTPVMSPVISLAPDQEPTGDGDVERGNDDDDNGDLTVDFGFFMPVSVGNQIWNDANNDGIMDPEEAGIGDVVVELYEEGADPATDDPVATVTTDSDGNYMFDDLAPGDYFLYIPEPPADYPTSSDNTDMNDNGEDGDDNGDQPEGSGTPVMSPVFNLTPGQEPADDGDPNSDETMDFGFYAAELVNLGNLVWLDANDNGMVDDGEEGIEGVTVELYEAGQTPGTDDPIATDTTDADGMYNFDDLAEGTYVVYIPEPPADYPTSSTPSDEADNGEDNDDNGMQDNSGDPIMSPEITLMVGEEPAEENDGDGTNGDLTVDFGLFAPLSVGNTVWHDENNDGVKDPEEEGVEGVVVELYEADADPATDDPVATVTTDPDGMYTFDELAPGDYFIYIPQPPADQPASSDNTDMADNGEDNDDNGDQPEGAGTPVISPVFNLSSGDEPVDDGDPNSDETLDFGFYTPAGVNIGDYVWHDANNDSEVGPTESGIEGVEVQLFKAGDDPTVDDPTATDVTDESGLYNFDGLEEGTYFIYIPEPPADFPVSSDNTDMADNQEDNDDNGDQPGGTGTPVTSPDITLMVGEEPTDDGDGADGDLTVDFGFYAKKVSLGDEVWHDENNDGVRDPEEAGIEGVVVELYEAGSDPATADPIATDTTDADGIYHFDELPEGTYVVYIPEPPADFPASSEETDMEDNSEDNDDNGDQPAGVGEPVISPEITLVAGEESTEDGTTDDQSGDEDGDQTVDFGFWTPQPSIDVEKSTNGQDADTGDGPAVMVGETVKWTYAVENTGNVALKDIKVTDDQEGAIDCPKTELAAGEIMTCEKEGIAVEGAYANMAKVEGTPTIMMPNDPNGGLVDDEDPSHYMGVPEAKVNLGNQVWHDEDNDSILDDEEEGIDGVEVQLFGATDDPLSDEPLATDTTSGGGFYAFNNLEPGEYVVYIPEPPLDFPASSSQADGDDNGEDGDNNGRQPGEPGTPVISPVIALGVGEEPTEDGDGADGDLTVDFGFYKPDEAKLNLGNLVWHDIDNNGEVDDGERGISDVKVQLFKAGDDPTSATSVQETTTSSDGFYNFEQLDEGDYFVYIPEAPAQYPGSSTPTDGEDNGEDNDDNGDQGAIGDPVRSPVVNLELANEPAEDVDGDGSNGELTIDFGFWTPSAVGDRVWEDNNADGIQDPGESGVGGVSVSLFQGNGTPMDMTTTTDEDGNYLFEDLPPGSYYVVFDVNDLPDDYVPTKDNQGTDDAADSDAFGLDSSAPGQTDPTEPILSGEQDRTLDMGIYRPVRVGDKVFIDQNRDGLQDAGEPGVEGVKVTLFNGDGTPTDLSTETDSNGEYVFEGLPPGSYYVIFDTTTIPPGFVITTPNAGDDDTRDSDANPSSGQTAPTPLLSSGEEDMTLDMGIQEPQGVRLGDTVWEDSNANGIQDPGEPGVAGVNVTLFHEDGTPTDRVTTTDESGSYLFDNLTPGSYYVVFDKSTLDGYVISDPNVGDDDSQDSDADPNDGRTPATPPIPDGEEDLTLDMGIYKPASIGNFVWNDRNANGTQDPGEEGVPSVTVNLLRPDGTVVSSTTTDPSGFYQFTDLVPGEYVLEFVSPDGMVFSPVDQGGDDQADSDADPNNGRTPLITLTSGTNDPTWDVGLYETGSIGNFVWDDADGDGVQDGDEGGLPGITIELFDAEGTLVQTTTTDDAGGYTFFDLKPGDYYIEVQKPDGKVFTKFDSGDDDGRDSDINPTSNRTPIITLDPGEDDDTVDIGLTEPASIGRFVWLDEDQDGLKGDNEPGVAGIVVNLYNSETQELVDTTLTDANGFFEFNEVTPGEYALEFMRPTNYEFTNPGQGSEGDFNSDADPVSGITQPLVLTPGETNDQTGAGLVVSDEVPNGPNAIDLVSFTAQKLDGMNAIRWITGSEIDTFGFHLYRSINGRREDAVRITKQMVPALGAEGGEYLYEDSELLPGFPYVYWLVEVENGVEAHEFGPVGAYSDSNFSNPGQPTDRNEDGFTLFLPLIQN